MGERGGGGGVWCLYKIAMFNIEEIFNLYLGKQIERQMNIKEFKFTEHKGYFSNCF